MKKFALVVFATALFAVWFSIGAGILAQERRGRSQVLERHTRTPNIEAPAYPEVSTTIVISQVQMGGSIADDEFIEIHNVGATAIDLNGYRIVYRSSSGTNDVGPFGTWTTSTILQPGQFYLIGATGYDGPTQANLTWNSGTGSMSGTAGGLAIKNSGGTVIDAVGWGAATNIFFEGVRTTAPGNNNSQARKQNGCQDTDNNQDDFQTLTPSGPRNLSSTPLTCGSDPSQLYAAMTANPSSVVASGTTLLTVAVVPATTPPSTGIQVTGNLSQIGGSSMQQFFDDGTNGDETIGDNVFSYLASIPSNHPQATYNVTAVASDAEFRSRNVNTNITVTGVPEVENHILLGNPTNATTDVGNENNYLLVRPQLVLSYSRANETPNWVAWRLDSTWIGGSGRAGDFAPDPLLPAGWYRVTDGDYSGGGYDRGHMTPSGDRTRSASDNQATFYMTNIIPQLSANNQGPWADFENYCRTLAGQNKEIYIVSGPHGKIGELATDGNGVAIPQSTWKVVLVLDKGNNDLNRVDRTTRTFGIIISNQSVTNGSAWRNYRVTVDQVEALTGYNFWSNVPVKTQRVIEARVDTQ